MPIPVPELLLSESLAARIRSHGENTYPHECCGAILGSDSDSAREVRELYPLVNRRDDSPRNRFSITAQDFRDAERAAQSAGLDVVGWYHSHPDHPALPSEYDREHAWPWYSYIIVSVQKGEAPQMRSWRLRDDRGAYDTEAIEQTAELESPAAALR